MVDSDDDEDGSAPTAGDGDGTGSSFLRLIRKSLKPHAGQDTPAGLAELGFSVLDELSQASSPASGDTSPAEAEGEPASFVEHARSSLDGHRRLEERRREMHAGAQFRKRGSKHADERPSHNLPLASVDCLGEVENLRSSIDEEELRALCASLEALGQLQNIVVVRDKRNPKRFHVVAGFRRYLAACRLGWKHIKAEVLEADTPLALQYLVNASENGSRSDPSDIDLAACAIKMRDRFGTTLEEFARVVGVAVSRVYWTTEALERLAPDLIAEWRQGHPLLNRRMIMRLSKLPHDVASVTWAERKATYERGNAATPDDDEDKPRRYSAATDRPPPRELDRLWLTVRRLERESFTKSEVCQLIDYARGVVRRVDGIFDPRTSHTTAPRRRQLLRRRDRELSLPAEPGQGFALGGEP